jgi:hypothetical protein
LPPARTGIILRLPVKHPHSTPHRSARFLQLPVSLAIALTLASAISAQNDLPLKGIVVTKDGQPIAGAEVHGGIWKPCCPPQQDYATTDANGEFYLEHSGAVIHPIAARMLPTAFVVIAGASPVRIVMAPDLNEFTVPVCSELAPTGNQFGGGENNLRFTVPRSGERVSRGQRDVDYIEYAVKTRHGHSYLALWFGATAFSPEPEGDEIGESSDLSQRNLVTVHGDVIGEDSRGSEPNGTKWRHAGIVGSGAEYRNASAEDVPLFDQIINSMCIVRSPNP